VDADASLPHSEAAVSRCLLYCKDKGPSILGFVSRIAGPQELRGA